MELSLNKKQEINTTIYTFGMKNKILKKMAICNLCINEKLKKA